MTYFRINDNKEEEQGCKPVQHLQSGQTEILNQPGTFIGLY